MYLGYSHDPGKGFDIPIDELSRVLLRSGQSLGASGLFSSVLLSILDRGAALPADDRRAAKIVGLHTSSYRASLKECLADGSLVRLPNGDVWAPIVGNCKTGKPIRFDRLRRGAIPSATRGAVLAKTNGKCVYCATVLTFDADDPTAFQPDHVLPVVLGGTDDVANLVPSCRSCNSKKRAKTALRFMADGGTDEA